MRVVRAAQQQGGTNSACRRWTPRCSIARMAWEYAVSEPQIVDSRGFGTPQFGERQHAKCGRLSVHGFAKTHPIHTPQGKACAAVATPGHANGSPYLRKITDMTPEGSGGVLVTRRTGASRTATPYATAPAGPSWPSNRMPRPNCSAPGPGCRGSASRTRARSTTCCASGTALKENLLDGGVRRGGPGPKPHTRTVELPSMCTCHPTSIG